MLKYYVWLQCYPALRGIFHTLWYVRPIPSKIQNIQNSRTESQIKLWCCICFRKHRGSKKSKKHYFSLSSKKYLSSCLQTSPKITKNQSKTHKRVTVRHTLVRKPSPLQPRPPTPPRPTPPRRYRARNGPPPGTPSGPLPGPHPSSSPDKSTAVVVVFLSGAQQSAWALTQQKFICVARESPQL